MNRSARTSRLSWGLMAAAGLAWLVADAAPADLPTASIEDAIGMTRIQPRVSIDGGVAAFSSDGSRFAAVVWRGDLARNVNVYTLLLFETKDVAQGASKPPVRLLSRDFEGDPDDQSASPITDVTFLPDNKTIAFIGREGVKPAQVYSVDVDSKQLRQLTDQKSAVRSFVIAPDGALRAFSVVADDSNDAARLARLAQDGVFVADRDVFPDQRRFMTDRLAVVGDRPRQVRQYYLAAGPTPRLIFDSRQSRPRVPADQTDPKVARAPSQTLADENALRGWSSLTADARGRFALLFPYGLTDHEMQPERYRYYDTMNAYARRVAAPYGLVDLANGHIERLIDTPHTQFARETGPPLWAPDGRSVVIHSLLPLDGASATENAAVPPQWLEVEIATRKITQTGVPAGWRVVRWDPQLGLILSRGSAFGRMARGQGGAWGRLEELGTVEGFSPNQAVSTDGRIVVGVQEGTLTPPELAVFSLASRQTQRLTDLNPELRRRRYGAVEPMRWAHKYEKNAFAFLVKPVGYEPGRRYPLVVLLDDGVLRQEGEPFLLDGTLQLSGHAIQMLSASGFVVLYPREPLSLRSVIELPEEGVYYREHVESAIAELDRAGLIDPARVGISGWSRAGYHTDDLLMRSNFRFAAASKIDGGSREYTDGMRPYTDDELRRIRTPFLLEAHGPASLTSHAGMADRLEALGKPVEVLYFATASHSTTRPQHRLRSLGTHLDWWRFWLQDYQDPSPAKTGQYARWQALRKLQ